MHHNYNERQHTISKSKAEEAKEQLEICGQRHFAFEPHLNTDYLQLFLKEELIVGELRFPSSGLDGEQDSTTTHCSDTTA